METGGMMSSYFSDKQFQLEDAKLEAQRKPTLFYFSMRGE